MQTAVLQPTALQSMPPLTSPSSAPSTMKAAPSSPPSDTARQTPSMQASNQADIQAYIAPKSGTPARAPAHAEIPFAATTAKMDRIHGGGPKLVNANASAASAASAALSILCPPPQTQKRPMSSYFTRNLSSLYSTPNVRAAENLHNLVVRLGTRSSPALQRSWLLTESTRQNVKEDIRQMPPIRRARTRSYRRRGSLRSSPCTTLNQNRPPSLPRR